MAGWRRGLPSVAGGAWPVARVTRGLCLSLQIPPDLSGCLGRPGRGRINGHPPLPLDLLPCPGKAQNPPPGREFSSWKGQDYNNRNHFVSARVAVLHILHLLLHYCV